MRSPYPLFMLMVTVLVFGSAQAGPMRHVSETTLHVSRYVESTPGPTEAQFNPLHVVIPRVRFGNHIHSIGQAINELLIDTGYRLARFHPDQRITNILALRLPDIQRNMGPLTLEQALKTLVSEPWILSVDPVHRLVSYEMPDYKYHRVQKRPVRQVVQHRVSKRVSKPNAVAHHKPRQQARQHSKQRVSHPVTHQQKNRVKPQYDWGDIKRFFGEDDE